MSCQIVKVDFAKQVSVDMVGCKAAHPASISPIVACITKVTLRPPWSVGQHALGMPDGGQPSGDPV